MKSSAVGLGVLGCLVSASACADPLTLYGIVDTGIYAAWGGSQPSVQGQDHYHTSRFGIRGDEQLAPGLNAIFKLESRFLPKNGKQQDSATLFNDETYVGLDSDKYGKIRLGRIYSPFYLSVAGRIDPFNGDGIGSMTGFTSIGHNLSPGNPYDTQKGLPNLDVRTSDAIDYTSPTIAGFTLQYQTSLPGYGISRQQSAVVKYDGTTFFTSVGYERQAYMKHAYTWNVGGGVNLGPVKITTGFTQGYYSDDEWARGNKSNAQILGVTYRPNQWHTFLAAVSRLHSDMPTLIDAAKGTGSSAIKFAGGYEYNFSKRTTVYFHYAHVTKPIALIFVSNTSKVMVGIDHKF